MASEKRLIDANRALEIVYEQGIAHPNAYHLTNYATLILQEAPTVDAVPVVRCKDCKYVYYYNEEGCRGFVCNGYFQYGDVEPNDFCSYGEMRNNDE